MELADADVVQQLVSSAEMPGMRRNKPRSGAPPVKADPYRVRPRCRCGSCPGCLADARWERIFQEKFADPDYYRRGLQLHQGSSLNW
jgi:hypothetical protein